MSHLQQPKRLKLLYRGSDNEFSAKAFHQKCDSIRNTLTIVKTEFGTTIAAFTEYSWNSKNAWVSNEGKNAFLLSLDLKEKYNAQNVDKLIYGDPKNGPIFGEGIDLHISDECNRNHASFGNFAPPKKVEGEEKVASKQIT